MKKFDSVFFKLLFSLSLLLLLVLFFLSASGLQFIKSISTTDTQWFLWLNRKHNFIWDPIMYAASDKLFWFPFYGIIILFLYESFGLKCWKVLLRIGLLIASSDQIASGLIKNTVKRLRPSHEADLIPLIHLSKAGPGGMYGFVSSHTANAFALTVFLVLLMDKSYRTHKVILILWALLVSYSRIYNGVHYPLDVLVAAIIGSLLGYIFYLIYIIVFKKNDNKTLQPADIRKTN